MKGPFFKISEMLNGDIPMIDAHVHTELTDGKGAPVSLFGLINEIEINVGKSAQKTFLPMQDGDVAATWADVSDLDKTFNYKPQVSLNEGVKKFRSVVY